MTVCITGDVHHMSLGTRDQEYLDGRTEVDCALEYARIAAEYDVPVTLFVTGKCAVEEPEKMRRLGRMDNVEIGGHNFWAFSTLVHKAWRGISRLTGGRVGSWNGPRRFQSVEIQKTIKALGALDIDITSWRNHAYRHDWNTAELLAEHGITHFSDAVEPEGDVRCEDGVVVVPINTPPDHEHVYHAFRTTEYIQGSGFEGPFGSESYEAENWVDRVIDAIKTHVSVGRATTVLAHPACLSLADDLESFDRLCKYVGDTDNYSRCSDITVDGV